MNILPNNLLTNGDLWTAMGGASLLCIALLTAVAFIRKNPWNRPWTIACLAGLVIGITGTVFQAPHPNDVMVDHADTQLLLSPFTGAEVKGTLAAGEKLRATNSHGDFAYVTSESGSAGWAEKANLSRYVGTW
jgi:hypothetical protein